MEIYIGIAVAVVFLFIIISDKLYWKRHLPYKKAHLLTKTEYAFWKVLQQKAAMHSMLVCPKVRMEDFITVTSKSKQGRMSWRGKIKSRHVDFVLCDKDLNMLAGIELDDNSHKYNKDTINSDKFKNAVFHQIGVPLYRFPTKKELYCTKIDEMINSFVNPQATTEYPTLK